MKFISLDPPGTFCSKYAFEDLVNIIKSDINTFAEIGLGQGKLSAILLRNGMNGYGIDFSEEAIEEAQKNLGEYIKAGRFTLLNGDIMHENYDIKVDLLISMMVMEHVENDILFLEKLASLIKNNGYLILGVPARKDKWGIEDECCGHYRRYEKKDFERIIVEEGYEVLKIWSVAVPVANILLKISNYLYKRSIASEISRKNTQEKTKNSGILKIKYKTVFPEFFKLVLNDYVMGILKYIQRFFYTTDYGIIIYALCRKNR